MNNKNTIFIMLLLIACGICSACSEKQKTEVIETVSESTTESQTYSEIESISETIIETEATETIATETIETKHTEKKSKAPVFKIWDYQINVGRITFQQLLDQDFKYKSDYWFEDDKEFKGDLAPEEYAYYYIVDSKNHWDMFRIRIENVTNTTVAYNDAVITDFYFDTDSNYDNLNSRIQLNDLYVTEESTYDDFEQMIDKTGNTNDFIQVSPSIEDKRFIWETERSDGYVYVELEFDADDIFKGMDISYSDSKKELETGDIEEEEKVTETEDIDPNVITADEELWDAWISSNTVMLSPFMDASSQVGFSWSRPAGQMGEEKECDFCLKNDNGSLESIPNMRFYYDVVNQEIRYTGIFTEDKEFFESDDFRKYCVMLTQAYNCHFEDGQTILNLTEDRAKEIVNFAFDEADHCLADGMRIRVIRDDDKPYYSFHLEY